MNVIARLEYELAYYDSAVHRFNHYTTRTPLSCLYPHKIEELIRLSRKSDSLKLWKNWQMTHWQSTYIQTRIYFRKWFLLNYHKHWKTHGLPNLCRRLDLVLLKKKENNRSSCGFCHFNGQERENKRNLKDWQLFGSCQRTPNTLKHENDSVNNSIYCLWNFIAGKATGRLKMIKRL